MTRRGGNDRLKVLIAAAEATPFAKVGGLGDAVSGLAGALSRLEVDARVIVPRYGSLERVETLSRTADLGITPLEVYSFGAALLESRLPGSQVPVYFVENADFFARAGIYHDPQSGEGFPDNFQRFVFFMKAVLTACRRLDWIPDVIHCNDSHTGLIPAYLKLRNDANSPLRRTASLFTIHNLSYQGRAGSDLFKLTDLPRDMARPDGPFQSGSELNLMKAGIVFADVLNTVSPTYAHEIQDGEEFGYGLQAELQRRGRDLYGILNGIDCDEWNPATDRYIPRCFHAARLAGKAENKMELQRFLGFPVNAATPLIGMISRLVEQKGLHLLLQAAGELLALNL
ncbi:MAG: glycogen synthase, partial [Acidobacteria bacterium]|nr:glycogen synthase [Acidobacteriota bacterium]